MLFLLLPELMYGKFSESWSMFALLLLLLLLLIQKNSIRGRFTVAIPPAFTLYYRLATRKPLDSELEVS